PVTMSRTRMMVVTADTRPTTNITGLRARYRGSSLRKASTIAGPMIVGSNSEIDFARRGASGVCAGAGVGAGVCDRARVVGSSLVMVMRRDALLRRCGEQRAGVHREVLDDRPERERREEREAADDQDHAGGEADEQAAVGREGAGRWRHCALGRERARDGEHR